jgi:hypothetical protein
MVKSNAIHLIAFVSLIASIVIWILGAMSITSIRASRDYLSVRNNGNTYIHLSLEQGQLLYEQNFMNDSTNDWQVYSLWIWEPGYHDNAILFSPFEFKVDGFPQDIRIALPLWTFPPFVVFLWLSIKLVGYYKKRAEQAVTPNA